MIKGDKSFSLMFLLPLGFLLSLSVIVFSFYDKYLIPLILFFCLFFFVREKYKYISLSVAFSLFFYTNFIICLFAYNIFSLPYDVDINFAQGMDFVFFCFLFMMIFIKKNVGRNLIFFFAISFLLYVVGVIKNGFVPATIYYRFMVYPLILYVIGLSLRGEFLSNVLFDRIIYLFFLFAALLLLFEVALGEYFYELFPYNHYISKKLGLEYYLSSSDLVEKNTKALFNFELLKNIEALRPMGVLIHPISLGYVFAIISIYFFYKKSHFLSLISIFFIICLGVKGALIALALTFSIYLLLSIGVVKKSRLLTFSLICFTFFAITMFYVGLGVGNPHMVNLSWSITELENNIFGNGIGSSGVFSAANASEGNLYKDSGLAVLLGQIGAFSIIVYLVYFYVVNLTIKANGGRALVFPIFAVFVLMNSLFQEEGFSPYSLGLIMFIMGLRSSEDRE